MKRIRCPKCENYLTFDETKYTEGQSLVFVCDQCKKQFSIRLGKSKMKAPQKEERPRVQGKFGTALCGSHLGSHAGALRLHPACLPPHAQRRKNDALRFRTGRTGAVQAQEDGYLLPILHVAGSRPSNNKHLW